MTIEIVDFPINSMVIFNSYVKLPEGTTRFYTMGMSENGVYPQWNSHKK